MIARIHRNGSDAPGLLAYVYGPGKAEEHTRPHMLASAGAGELAGAWWAGDFAAEHMGEELGADDARALGHLLQSDWRNFREQHTGVQFAPADMPQQPVLETAGGPIAPSTEAVRFVDPPWAGGNGPKGPSSPEFPAFAEGSYRPHVFHAVLSIRADEGPLSDEQWSRIATGYMQRMGFEADGDAGHAWAAFHHGASKNGNDHVHLVANKVSRGGEWWNEHYSLRRSRAAANELEDEFGLRPVQDRTRGQQAQEQGRGHRSPGEQRRAAEDQRAKRHPMGERERLEVGVRAAASQAGNEREFIEACLRSGIRVRPRFAGGGTSTVVGYSVALRNGSGDGAETVWHGGGRLAKDLTLGRLRERWGQTDADRREAVELWRRSVGVSPARDAAPGQRGWERAAERARRQADAAERLDPRSKPAWDAVRRDMAGQWAQLGQYGPKAHRKAAADLSQALHPTGRHPMGAASEMTLTAGRQLRVLSRAMSPSDTRAWLAVIVQMRRTLAAIEKAAEARRERVTAERIAQARRAEFAAAARVAPQTSTSRTRQPGAQRAHTQTARHRGGGIDRQER